MTMDKLNINVKAAIRIVEKATGLPRTVKKAHDLWLVLADVEDIHDITGTHFRVSDLEYALGSDIGSCVVNFEMAGGYDEAHFTRQMKKLRRLLSR